MFSFGGIGYLYYIIFRVLKLAGFRKGIGRRKGMEHGIGNKASTLRDLV